MGGFDLFLDIVGTGASLATAANVSSLRQQQMEAAARAAIVQQLRNLLFNFREASKSVLELRATYPVQAAAAMRLLAVRLDQTGITPDLLDSIEDKSFCSDTRRAINNQAAELVEQLSPDARQQVAVCIDSVTPIHEHSYYVDHYERWREYHDAQHRTGGGSGCMDLVSVLMLVTGGSAFLGALAWMSQGDSGQAGLATVIVALVAVPLMVGGGLLMRRNNKASTALRTVNQVKKEMDVDYMAELDRRYNGNIALIRVQRQRAVDEYTQMFAGTELLGLV